MEKAHLVFRTTVCAAAGVNDNLSEIEISWLNSFTMVVDSENKRIRTTYIYIRLIQNKYLIFFLEILMQKL